MQKYTTYTIIFVVFYIILVILASLLNNVVIIIVVGSAIVVIDKFVIPNFSKLQTKIDLVKNFNQLYELIIKENLEDHMAIELKLVLDKIGKDNLLKILKLTFTIYDEYFNNEDEQIDDYALSNKEYKLIINFRFGQNSIKIYKKHSFYDYNDISTNWEIKRDFIDFFKNECKSEGIKLKNRLSKTVRQLEEQSIHESSKASIIDFELIFHYLEMLENGEISEDNLYDTLHSIDQRLQKIHYYDEIKQNELLKLTEICKRLTQFMKSKKDNTQRRVLSILYDYTYNMQTEEILKNMCYTYLIELFEDGKNHQNLYNILDKLEFFNNNLEELIINAIKKDDKDFLNNVIRYIDFTRHHDNRLEIITTLHHLLDDINKKDQNLREIIKRIIKKFE